MLRCVRAAMRGSCDADEVRVRTVVARGFAAALLLTVFVVTVFVVTVFGAIFVLVLRDAVTLGSTTSGLFLALVARYMGFVGRAVRVQLMNVSEGVKCSRDPSSHPIHRHCRLRATYSKLTAQASAPGRPVVDQFNAHIGLKDSNRHLRRPGCLEPRRRRLRPRAVPDRPAPRRPRWVGVPCERRRRG